MANEKTTPQKNHTVRNVGIAAVLIALLGGGYGYGTGMFGTGDGVMPGSSQAEVEPQEGQTEEIPDTIIIRIEEDEVTVNGTVCKDAAELKAYLEKVLTDDRIFVLEDEKAILASYEWVEDTCKELGIDLKK
ncbi:MAG: hypothetical protein K6G61_03165 [Solobacterium sp.]|nr:hypothetical protein [Solobacterium sp.]